MSQDKMREGFEAWYGNTTKEWPEAIIIACREVQFMVWKAAWQASRADLVVKLPQPFEGDDFGMYDRDELLRAFEAAGIKVAP